MSSRDRSLRDELRELELYCEAHPVTCDCESCERILILYAELAELDPDEHDPDDQPFWWNR